MAASRPILLFFVTEDYYFVSHRLPVALAAKRAGYDVRVATQVRHSGDVIEHAGLRLIPFKNARSSLNPFTELLTLFRLIRLYRRERPSIVHHVALKPVLYGTIAARLAGTPRVINAVAGMGWLFTSGAGLARWLKPLVRRALRPVLKSGVALVQNPDDARLLEQFGVPKSRIRLIAGSGVDLQLFHPHAHSNEVPIVVLPARLLWDKGVGDFVAAARALRRQGIKARFVLAGEPDPANPATIHPDQVSSWAHEGVIENRGWVVDMPALLAESDVVCLPSYREGLPKSLIEAAAAGRPIVTTDVPGCREVVRHGDNGLLVQAGDIDALAHALESLIENPDLRSRMGARGRIRAEQEFGLDAVLQQTLALYRETVA